MIIKQTRKMHLYIMKTMIKNASIFDCIGLVLSCHVIKINVMSLSLYGSGGDGNTGFGIMSIPNIKSVSISMSSSSD